MKKSSKNSDDLLKSETLNLIKKELSLWGVDPSKVFFDGLQMDIHVDEHVVDQLVFIEKTEWERTDLKIKSYTSGGSKIFFMPPYENFEEIRENEDLKKKLDSVSNEVDIKVSEFISQYLEKIRLAYENKSLLERIPDKIKDNYQNLSDSLLNLENWKAKIILKNSNSDKSVKKGHFDDVGYVLIGIQTGTIVPVARSDEHRKGWDLVHYLMNKKLVPDDNYFAIYNSSEYADYNDPVAVQAFKTWRKLGGKNLVIKNNSSTDLFQVTMDDYIRLDGKIKIEKGELLPIGNQFINLLKQLAQLTIEARKNDKKEKFAYKQALRVFEYYHQCIDIYMSDEKKQNFLARVSAAESLGGETGILDLDLIFFGFDGLKNNLHNLVRDSLKKDLKHRSSNDLATRVFGDLDLANHILGSF